MAILIVANNNDHSTQKVEEWLNFYKRNYKKYNFSKLCNQLNLTYRLNTKEETLLLDWFEQDKIPSRKYGSDLIHINSPSIKRLMTLSN